MPEIEKSAKYKYSNITIGKFKLLGIYIVEIFYIHLYDSALVLKAEKKVESLTEGYKYAIYKFMSTVNPDEKTYDDSCYVKLLNQIVNCYRVFDTSIFTTTDFINVISKEFIPTDYENSLAIDEKRKVVKAVIINSIKSFQWFVTNKFLGEIIDNYKNKNENMAIMQEQMVNILSLEREKMFDKFLKARSGSSGGGKSGSQEKIDKSIAIGLQEKISNAMKELKEINKRNSELEAADTERKTQMLKLIERIKFQKKNVDSLSEENELLKARVQELEAQVQELQGKVDTHEMYARESRETARRQTRKPRDYAQTQSDARDTPTHLEAPKFQQPSVQALQTQTQVQLQQQTRNLSNPQQSGRAKDEHLSMFEDSIEEKMDSIKSVALSDFINTPGDELQIYDPDEYDSRETAINVPPETTRDTPDTTQDIKQTEYSSMFDTFSVDSDPKKQSDKPKIQKDREDHNKEETPDIAKILAKYKKKSKKTQESTNDRIKGKIEKAFDYESDLGNEPTLRT